MKSMDKIKGIIHPKNLHSVIFTQHVWRCQFNESQWVQKKTKHWSPLTFLKNIEIFKISSFVCFTQERKKVIQIWDDIMRVSISWVDYPFKKDNQYIKVKKIETLFFLPYLAAILMCLFNKTFHSVCISLSWVRMIFPVDTVVSIRKRCLYLNNN